MSETSDQAREYSGRGIFIMPRVLRLRDAPRYLGMDRNRFNAEVRPHLTTIPIGNQGVAFARGDLDALGLRFFHHHFEHTICLNGGEGRQRTSLRYDVPRAVLMVK